METTERAREYPPMLTCLYAVKRLGADGALEHMPAFRLESSAWSYAAVIRGAYVVRVSA